MIPAAQRQHVHRWGTKPAKCHVLWAYVPCSDDCGLLGALVGHQLLLQGVLHSIGGANEDVLCACSRNGGGNRVSPRNDVYIEAASTAAKTGGLGTATGQKADERCKHVSSPDCGRTDVLDEASLLQLAHNRLGWVGQDHRDVCRTVFANVVKPAGKGGKISKRVSMSTNAGTFAAETPLQNAVHTTGNGTARTRSGQQWRRSPAQGTDR